MGARHTFKLLPRPYCPSTTSCGRLGVLLHLSQGDISEWSGDVVVSAANSSLEGSSRLKSWWGFAGKKNVEQALHAKAGLWLQHSCNEIKVVRYKRDEAYTSLKEKFGERNRAIESIVETRGKKEKKRKERRTIKMNSER